MSARARAVRLDEVLDGGLVGVLLDDDALRGQGLDVVDDDGLAATQGELQVVGLDLVLLEDRHGLGKARLEALHGLLGLLLESRHAQLLGLGRRGVLGVVEDQPGVSSGFLDHLLVVDLEGLLHLRSQLALVCLERCHEAAVLVCDLVKGQFVHYCVVFLRALRRTLVSDWLVSVRDFVSKSTMYSTCPSKGDVDMQATVPYSYPPHFRVEFSRGH